MIGKISAEKKIRHGDIVKSNCSGSSYSEEWSGKTSEETAFELGPE